MLIAIALFAWIVVIPAVVVLVRLRVALSRVGEARPAAEGGVGTATVTSTVTAGAEARPTGRIAADMPLVF